MYHLLHLPLSCHAVTLTPICQVDLGCMSLGHTWENIRRPTSIPRSVSQPQSAAMASMQRTPNLGRELHLFSSRIVDNANQTVWRVATFPNTVISLATVFEMYIILELEEALVRSLLSPTLVNHRIPLESDQNDNFED